MNIIKSWKILFKLDKFKKYSHDKSFSIVE